MNCKDSSSSSVFLLFLQPHVTANLALQLTDLPELGKNDRKKRIEYILVSSAASPALEF